MEKLNRPARRALLWLRVSTKDQRFDSEEEPLALYCRARGLEVVGRVEEHGVSGAATYRKAVEDVLRRARRREFDIVLVYRGDRAFRSAGRGVMFIDELLGLGCHFASVGDGIDTSTPAGAVMAKLVMVLAEWTRAGIVATVKDGIAAYRRKHGRWGRSRKLDAEAVERARTMRQEGRTLAAVAAELGCGVTTAWAALERS
jgi:DNA invertase Pin-like site-specific DNA recombinase